MIKEVEGNILEQSECYYIMQQVNCQGGHVSGLFGQIAKKYPEIYNYYNNYINAFSTGKNNILGKILLTEANDEKYCFINIFGQLYPCNSIGEKATDYESVKQCFKKIKQAFEGKRDVKIAIPYKMCCGLAGGDWDIIYKMINDILAPCMDIYIYHYNQ